MQVSRDTLGTKARVWVAEQPNQGLWRPATSRHPPLSLLPFNEPIASHALAPAPCVYVRSIFASQAGAPWALNVVWI